MDAVIKLLVRYSALNYNSQDIAIILEYKETFKKLHIEKIKILDFL